MRDWINLFENVVPDVVYHGGKVDGPIHTPFFVSPDLAFAQSYADDRRGEVIEFRFNPRKTADSDEIEDAAAAVGIEIDGTEMPYKHISPNINDYATEVIAELQRRGFDSALFSDFAMNDSFSEYPAYAVFDPTILTRA